MSPITHFLTGWVFANCFKLQRRDRDLVTLASVAPDIDGLGIVPELLTRNSTHPLMWFSNYHHSLHTLAFACVMAIIAFLAARQKWKTAILAFFDGVVRDATAYTEHANHKTVSVQDIVAALRKRGRALYGY